MIKQIRIAVLFTALLVVSTISMARAWSESPPTKAVISDPGLASQSAWLVRNVGTEKQTIGFDMGTGTARFILPRGIRSADGSAYWSSLSAGGMTALYSFDTANGSVRTSLAFEGNWTLGAVSTTGKWLALKRTPSAQDVDLWSKTLLWKTTVAIVDAESGKTTRTIALDGNFDVDALDTVGTSLYLIEHLPAIKPDHYQVRRYDLTLGQLVEGALVDKRNIDEVMAGYPTDAVGSPDGQWLFTLYVGMRGEHAFIHALNVREGYAWCIDLPSGDGDEATLEHYSLALGPDGHTIYASNAVLGTLAFLDITSIGEPRVVQFAQPGQVDANRLPTRSSIISRDGKFAFFSDGGTLWQYDVTGNTTHQVKRDTMPILGLAFNEDQSALLIAQADQSVATIALGTVNAGTQTTSMTNGEKQGTCPITKPPAQTFAPGPGYTANPTFGGFWYGTPKLWTALQPQGTWYALPYDHGAYSQKVVWWREGYVGTAEQQPALRVTGKQLDGNATFAAEGATNANSPDFAGNGWAIMTGIEIPALGCWEITGEYKGEALSFVVQVLP